MSFLYQFLQLRRASNSLSLCTNTWLDYCRISGRLTVQLLARYSYWIFWMCLLVLSELWNLFDFMCINTFLWVSMYIPPWSILLHRPIDEHDVFNQLLLFWLINWFISLEIIPILFTGMSKRFLLLRMDLEIFNSTSLFEWSKLQWLSRLSKW